MITDEVIIKAWMDETLNATEAAASIGLSRSHHQKRAKKLGLPPRTKGNYSRLKGREGLFIDMWNAGVFTREMATVFDCDRYTVSHIAARINLKPRDGGHKYIGITLDRYKDNLMQEVNRKRKAA